jgi:hypothetical protein
MNRTAAALLTIPLLAALSACSSTGTTSAQHASPDGPTTATSATAATTPSSDESAALRVAVQAYSDAFLTGDVKTYDLLSARCQQRTDRNYFIGILAAAKSTYGSALPIRTFNADIQGTLARVTYTYDLSAINQSGQPWVREGGAWKDDSCH